MSITIKRVLMHTRRAIATLAATALTAAGLVAMTAAPAAAATICSKYTNGEVWQTSTRWGRVQLRICLEYTSLSVRGKVTMRLDYPADCSLTVGLPPSAGASCPASRLTKSANLDFHGTKMRVGIKRGSTTTQWKSCEFGAADAATYQPINWSCNSLYWNDSYSSYRIFASDVMGDVKDDGDGWKVLAPEDWTFSSPN